MEALIRIIHTYFKSHRLQISTLKSKVMTYDANTGHMNFEGFDDEPLNLEVVIAFKYLGITISSSPYCLFKAQNCNVVKRAHAYMNSIMSLVRNGPDRSELAYRIWRVCGLPSVLYGSEIVHLTRKTIEEVEKCNTRIGKFILQVPQSSANVACYIDAGLPPVKCLIAEKVLTYSSNLMRRPASFWPKIALTENIRLGLESSYTRNLLRWSKETNCFMTDTKSIKSVVHKHYILDILDQQRKTSYTTFALRDRDSIQHPWFQPKPWITDGIASRTIASFRVLNVQLGNRGPAINGQFYKLCPLCREKNIIALNNEVISLGIVCLFVRVLGR